MIKLGLGKIVPNERSSNSGADGETARRGAAAHCGAESRNKVLELEVWRKSWTWEIWFYSLRPAEAHPFSITRTEGSTPSCLQIPIVRLALR
jgi:hypothetical protein